MTTKRTFPIRTLAASLLLLGAVSSVGHATALADPAKLVCHSYVRLTEQQAKIPTQLLESIALTESAKWYSPLNRTIAWPWTVMAEGKGRYFETKQEAINEVMKLRAKGVRNIDVGCMQINLMHHPDAFTSLEEAFDPQTNVRYSAKFLLDLKSRFATWSNAVGYYHSATPEFHFKYRQKVLNKWRETRQQNPNGLAIAPYTVASNTPYDYKTYKPSKKTTPITTRKTSSTVQRYYPVQQSASQMRSQIMNMRRSGHLKVITF